MSQSPRPPILVTADGGLTLRLSAGERAILRSVTAQLRDLLSPVDDPSAPAPDELRRLLPTAYPTDVEAQSKFEESQREEILGHHRRALEILEETADADRLSNAEAEAWLGAVTELRLVYGTALGVEETWSEPRTDDPRYGEWLAYGYLTYLASELVDALSPLLPPYAGSADGLAPEDPWGEPPGDLRWDGTPAPKQDPE
ncbi:MAG: DUF2017 family protein [Acidimicrobiales bacterium]